MLIPGLRHRLVVCLFAIYLQPIIRDEVVPVHIFEELEARCPAEEVEGLLEMIECVPIHAGWPVLRLCLTAVLIDLGEAESAEVEFPEVVVVLLAYVGARSSMDEGPVFELLICADGRAHPR